jgi:hypothetical protein
MEETNANGHISASSGMIVNFTLDTIFKGNVSASQTESYAEALVTAPKSPMKKKPKKIPGLECQRPTVG